MKARIGVMPETMVRQRMLAILNGSYKPAANEPKIWYNSLASLAQILSLENIALLSLMHEQKPETVTELAALAGRHKSNLSKTLKTLENRGFVKMEIFGAKKRPVALFTEFDIRVENYPSAGKSAT
ncbi:MarR family transcriptional regulator [Rahnella woolbedingensis]|uniref:MarR family transcriptional regulator n=1 Tax=Rahnella woolbedingensis TaxID=1510574 RepID=A0A419N4S2_9GAMM|nr:MarR family transcriptional regulator [Rahnella woolbedingensis]RJT40162.1 MarR family transcriptional regulator [Rahnella woolbedingensis]